MAQHALMSRTVSGACAARDIRVDIARTRYFIASPHPARTVEHVMTYQEVTDVTVPWDSPEKTAKLTWMNVQAILVKTTERVLIREATTPVSVLLVLLAETVR